MMLANNTLRAIHVISFDCGGWCRSNARHFIYWWVMMLCAILVLCAVQIGVSDDIDMILFGSALWCCGQFVQICLLMNGNVVDNIRISLIGKWQYRIPSARFHSVANANGVLNPTGVEHTIGGYHRTNTSWLNATQPFIVRQNHGGKVHHWRLSQNKYTIVECNITVYHKTKSRGEGIPLAIITKQIYHG